MRSALAEKWQTCLAVLKKRVGDERYNLWFKNLELVELSESRLTLGVPSAFVAEWLETKFRQDIADCVYATTGERTEVKFRVIPNLFGKLRAENLKEGASLIQGAGPNLAAAKEENDVRPEFRLSNFIVGPCNQLAFAAARDVASSAKPTFNPLFYHGPIGVGKTHLLQGIYSELGEKKPHLKVRYAHAERFTNQFVFAMKNGRLDSFRHMYREADVLLIDDVQFFSNKMGFQEEFLHTFNALVSRDHQVVMASDSHPRDLAKIHEGLASRFMSGMVVRLEPPQFATRLAILKSKAARFQNRIDEDVFKHIAQMCQGNVRDLEGALTTVLAYASLSGAKVDLGVAREILLKPCAPRQGPVTLELIESLVLKEFGLSRADLCARKRAKSVSFPRQVCMYLARKWTTASAQDIGAHFGGRNHTTVLFAEKKIEQALVSDQQTSYHIRKIEGQIERG